MSSKVYWLKFGPDDPRSFTGLSPTFLLFQPESGTALTPPGITERITGASGTGFYQFSYDTSLSVAFLVDGGATLSLSNRYVTGVLDPVMAVEQRVGLSGDTYGSSSVDPTTIFGYVKRLQEFLEGNSTFTKATGIWAVLSRAGATTLASKTLTNNSTQATKS